MTRDYCPQKMRHPGMLTDASSRNANRITPDTREYCQSMVQKKRIFRSQGRFGTGFFLCSSSEVYHKYQASLKDGWVLWDLSCRFPDKTPILDEKPVLDEGDRHRSLCSFRSIQLTRWSIGDDNRGEGWP